jgi:uncharacterized protein (TIGR02453 family)
MSPDQEFRGFSKKTVDFFKNLKRHNDRAWFEAHRDIYESEVMAPSRAFITAMGARLKTIAPKIVAIPKVNKSIFRINRDTRFSLDPTPYKTNLGLYFWEGTGGRMEGSGFYFHLEPPDLMMGGGMYMFSDKKLLRFRKAAVDKKLGKELAAVVKDLAAVPGFELGGKHYKRVPAGFDASQPNAPLLLHNGLYAGCEEPIPAEFFTPAIVDYCLEKFRAILPLYRWLVKAIG